MVIETLAFVAVVFVIETIVVEFIVTEAITKEVLVTVFITTEAWHHEALYLLGDLEILEVPKLGFRACLMCLS